MNESEVILLLSNKLPRALHVVQSLAVENGGTSVSIPALADATAATGRYLNSLLHFGPEGILAPRPDSSLTLLQRSANRLQLMFPTRSRAFLGRAVHNADVLQVHGLWTGHSYATLRFASKFGKPVIVSAHGMLDDWALRHKKWKKLPYSAFVERPKLSRATCLRALTKVEAENYRSFGLKTPVAVIPNGVDVPDNASPQAFFQQYPHLEGRKILLFIGRLHKKKGVDLLAKAWESVTSQLPDSHLVIAGPDDGALGASLRRDVAASGASSITFSGMLTGSLKWSAYSAAAAFVLPSFSEGLSMATLEALWLGVPILITRECNFREIEPLECTFLIEPTIPGIAGGVLDMLRRPSTELRARGAAGTQFVRANYGWPRVGQQMADVYDWMRGGPPPSSVQIFYA
jgi:glycosyltransferase involved in cell wall biosynthesis